MLAACGQAPKPSTATGHNDGSTTSSDHANIPPSNNEGSLQVDVQDKPQDAAQENDPVKGTASATDAGGKIGQMILAGVQGTTLDHQAKQMIANQKVGGIIFMPTT